MLLNVRGAGFMCGVNRQASVAVMVVLHVAAVTVVPPPSLPDLHLLFAAQFSCLCFVVAYGWACIQLWASDGTVAKEKAA